MIDLATITTAELLGETLARYGIDTDPVETAAPVVHSFWCNGDGRHLPVARLLRGIPINDSIVTVHAAQLVLYWQDPQNYWFHRIHEALRGILHASALRRWIQPIVFPASIAAESLALVRAQAEHAYRDSGHPSSSLDILGWCHIDTDCITPAQTMIYRAWERAWGGAVPLEARYLRGVAGHPTIIVACAAQLHCYTYLDHLDQWCLQTSLPLSDESTTVTIYQWIRQHYGAPLV